MREQHVKTLSGLLYSAGTAIILIGAILTALPEFGFNVTPIAAAAGLASLAFGFGAQHLVRDLINGFFIIIEDQFVVGEIRADRDGGRARRASDAAPHRGPGHSGRRGHHSQRRNRASRKPEPGLGPGVRGHFHSAGDASSDAALAALERVCAELRTDASWSPVLVDGPRALGVDSFGPAGATLRLQLRTVPGRQDDAARELRRRIQNRFEQEHIRWGGVQRVEIVGSEALQSLAARSNS